ncbi:MAG: PrsW family intramembrane metalloprotease [Pseudonocardia sp.]|nr:PrsW family intramembrane metalloprotease [Pseudonocardia sp.]
MGRRFAWLGVLVVGLAMFLLVYRTLIRTQDPNFVPAMILIGASVVPATFVTYVASRDGRWRVPASVVTGTAWFGGVLGTVVAGRLEYDTLRSLGAVPVLAVGVAEEAAKLIVPVALVVILPRLRSYRARLGGAPRVNPADGVVIGVAAGMGFAALETMGYAFVSILNQHSIDGVERLLFYRGLMSPVCHAAWTGLTSAALWRWAAGVPHGGLRFVLTFALAVMLHATWDSLSTPPVMATVAAISGYGLFRELHRSTLFVGDAVQANSP